VGFKRIKMTIAHLPAISTPIEKLWKERGAVPRTWANAVEKLRKKQIELKERTAAEKIVGRTKAVETVRGGFCGRASIAGYLRLAEPARAAEAVSPSDR
jgi:NADPH-dependent 2,4-dienoyl-CoA reductase/sulfur reductase-like enzyme